MADRAAAAQPRTPLRLRELEEQHVRLARADAQWLRDAHGRHITLISRDEAGGEWLVRPGRICGVLTLPSGRRLHVEPRVRVRNVWTMLAATRETGCLDWPPGASETLSGLVDGLMEMFVREMQVLIERGVSVGYQPAERVLGAVRGRIDVQRQVRELPGKLDRFACRFAEFSRETPENRVLAAALHVVLRAAPERPDLRASAARCLREVGCSEAPRLEQRDLAAARVSAATRHYRVPLALARLLVESLSAGHRPAAGFRAVKSPSLLVEMPRLFERFVCRTLQRGLAGDARVRSAGHSVPLDDGSHAMLTPDAVVEGRDGPLCVVDAKYKPEPTDRHEPSASDLYQMLAYCVGYDVGHAVLVYPRRMDASPVRIRREGFTAEIHPLGLDLSSEAHTLVPNGRALCERIRELIGLPPDDRARPVIALGGR